METTNCSKPPHTDEMQRFTSFAEFYPFYLSQHANLTSRRLHILGSSGVLIILIGVLCTGAWLALWLLPIFGYGCAWVGHFFFEHNRPATFKYPLYSLIGDFVMYREVLLGRLPL